MTPTSSRSRLVALMLLLAGLVLAVTSTVFFPAVKGLGTKVRMPVFHGALTWVNLAAFSLLAVAAIAFLVLRRPVLYRFAEALRWIAVPTWVIGSVLGLMAALNTWDFTGSKASPLTVAAADPRLTAQFWILLAALAVIALEFVLGDERWTAAVDIGFVALLWTVLMRAILGPGRALHPDSPVLNSDEISIKLYFFGIVAGLSLAMLSSVWLLAGSRMRAGAVAPEVTSGE